MSRPKLTFDEVHKIRTACLPDAHFARKLRRTTGTIRDARVGNTWPDHPTPADTKPRVGSPDDSKPEHT